MKTKGPRGTIKISSGDSQERVTIQLIAPNGIRTTVFTNGEGNFEFPKMRPLTYTLRVASPLEFKPFHQEIHVDGATKLDGIVLEHVSNSDFLPATQEIDRR